MKLYTEGHLGKDKNREASSPYENDSKLGPMHGMVHESEGHSNIQAKSLDQGALILDAPPRDEGIPVDSSGENKVGISAEGHDYHHHNHQLYQ